MGSRTVTVSRTTKETDVSVVLDPDGRAEIAVGTGVGFFDHLLHAMAFHGRLGLTLRATGDLHVDAHHLVEDAGLLLGDAFSGILAAGGRVARFGHAVVPMDEACAEVTIDVCGRPTLAYRSAFPQDLVGGFDTALLREFLHAFCSRARISLHAEIRYGENSHHMAEALFKALGMALRSAYRPAEEEMSAKGIIG